MAYFDHERRLQRINQPHAPHGTGRQPGREGQGDRDDEGFPVESLQVFGLARGDAPSGKRAWDGERRPALPRYYTLASRVLRKKKAWKIRSFDAESAG